MTWTKREAVTNLVILGDGEGNAKKIAGLLIGTPADKGYPDKINYEIVRKDGEIAVLSGSASLARQLNRDDIGKFIKCEFTGWGKSPNGKFKAIDVQVFEGEPTDEMKKWPMYSDVAAATQAQKKAAAQAAKAPASNGTPAPAAEPDDFDDYQHVVSTDDDVLPF